MNLFGNDVETINFAGAGTTHMQNQMLPRNDWHPPTEFPDLSSAREISLDIESKDKQLRKFGPGFVRGDAQVIGVSIATDDFSGYYPVRHEGGNLAPNMVFSWLRDILKGPGDKIMANGIYDLEGLWSENVKVNGNIYDVQNAEALLCEESDEGFALNNLAKKYTGSSKAEELLLQVQHVLKMKDVKGEMYRLPARLVGPYAEMDAVLTREVWKHQKPLLEREDLMSIFQLESDLTPLLLAMRVKGVRVDLDRAETVNKQLKKDVAAQQKRLSDLAGNRVDVWKNASLEVLCKALKVSYPLTAAGNPSFTAAWLSAHKCEELRMVANIRKIDKMRRDFIEGFVLEMNYKGRLHCQFHPLRKQSEASADGQEGTRSGRFSSTNPNLQQIPARDPYYGPLIRSLFIPDEGCDWMCGDYSAQEPRLTVHYAYASKLDGAARAVHQYNTDPNTDYHQLVADMAQITRKHAKVINLGLAYGMGKRKLALDLGFITDEQFKDHNFKQLPIEIDELFAKYHAAVPYVDALSKKASNLAQQRGYIVTLLKRRRHFDLYEPKRFGQGGKVEPLPLARAKELWPNEQLQRAMCHKALNALIQGSAADMMKKAMLDLWKAGYTPHLTIHDEVDSSIAKGDARAAREINEIMIEAVKLHVPVRVDCGIAPNWADSDTKYGTLAFENLLAGKKAFSWVNTREEN